MKTSALRERLLLTMNRFNIRKRLFDIIYFRFGFLYYPKSGRLEGMRNFLIKNVPISIVIDGGANSGQWAKEVLREFPNIVMNCFEPLTEPFKKLENSIGLSSNVKCYKVALGDRDYEANMNVASNFGASSSLKSPDLHLSVNPSVQFVSKEKVEIRSLDSLGIFNKTDNKIYFKLDVQGFELEALIGAEENLQRMCAIELEMSYSPLYSGEFQYHEVIEYLLSKDFIHIFSSIPRSDRFGRQWDFNSIFVRKDVWKKITFEKYPFEIGGN